MRKQAVGHCVPTQPPGHPTSEACFYGAHSVLTRGKNFETSRTNLPVKPALHLLRTL